MSTQEDREWDERQEYGYAHPLAPWMRESAIIADQLGPIEPEDFDPDAEDDDPQPVDNPVYDLIVEASGWNPLQETPGQTWI